MTTYLSLEESLRVVETAIGSAPVVRDLGLLESALARPSTALFGNEAYPELHTKAAALLQSVVGNHALVDGNKRAGFACVAVFLHLNGSPLTLDQDEAYELVIAVAEGSVDSIEEIAARLRGR